MIFIRTSGLTARQKEWYRSATSDERDAFFLLAPVRIAAQPCLLSDGQPGFVFAPTIHGIPVGTRRDLFQPSAEQAQAEGEDWQAKCRTRLAGREVVLDIQVLGITGAPVPEYADPGGEERAFFAEAEAAMRGGGLPTGQA